MLLLLQKGKFVSSALPLLLWLRWYLSPKHIVPSDITLHKADNGFCSHGYKKNYWKWKCALMWYNTSLVVPRPRKSLGTRLMRHLPNVTHTSWYINHNISLTFKSGLAYSIASFILTLFYVSLMYFILIFVLVLLFFCIVVFFFLFCFFFFLVLLLISVFRFWAQILQSREQSTMGGLPFHYNWDISKTILFGKTT